MNANSYPKKLYMQWNTQLYNMHMLHISQIAPFFDDQLHRPVNWPLKKDALRICANCPYLIDSSTIFKQGENSHGRYYEQYFPAECFQHSSSTLFEIRSVSVINIMFRIWSLTPSALLPGTFPWYCKVHFDFVTILCELWTFLSCFFFHYPVVFSAQQTSSSRNLRWTILTIPYMRR